MVATAEKWRVAVEGGAVRVVNVERTPTGVRVHGGGEDPLCFEPMPSRDVVRTYASINRWPIVGIRAPGDA